MPKSKQVGSTLSRDRGVVVLIAADADRSRQTLPSAFQLAQYRLSRKMWGLRKRTRFRASMTQGDRVLIYVSGHRELAQHFVAEAVLASAPTLAVGDMALDAPDFANSIASEYKVGLKSIRWFKRPVCARELIAGFSFVAPKRAKIWRIYFQGGALRISTKDANLILRGSR